MALGMPKVETQLICTTVNNYLINQLDETNIDNVKYQFKLYMKEDDLSNIHNASQLINCFQQNEWSGITHFHALKILVSLLNRNDLLSYLEMYGYLVSTLDIQNDDHFANIYKKVARTIEKRIGTYKVNDIKHDFKDMICSRRLLSQIQTVSELISILEDRDLVDDNNVAVLETILTKLEEKSLYDLVCAYKNLANISSQCKVCEVKTENFGHETNDSKDKKEHKPTVVNTACNDDLGQIILYLSKELGTSWKKLARILDVEEPKIKVIMRDFVGDTEEQIIQMLNYWRESNEDASIKTLLLALKHPVCKMNLLHNKIQQKKYLSC